MTKQIVAEQVQGAQMLKERTTLAAEIHDSLAQTLLATRNQLSLLKESMENSNDTAWRARVISLEESISIANGEVRELIHEYRSPLNGRKISDVLRDDIARFKKRSGIEVFLQCDDPLIQLNQNEEAAVQRIVGEALANAHKYASADMVRVYLHGDKSGIRTVLVEDDGVGFSIEGAIDDQEHFGMSIMQELALNIGGVLSVDSDPGEGTRVSLKLPPLFMVSGEGYE
jgi:two-component system nitrate/nitrite sensor histidine kinase NarX